MSIGKAEFRCDRRGCVMRTDDPVRAGWITTSGQVIVGQKELHDHRAQAGHYCSWDCFCKEPARDL